MSYECFRNSILSNLSAIVDPCQLSKIMATIDQTASDYNVTRRTHDLTVYGTIPQEVKMYIASKSVQSLSSGTLKLYYSRLCHFFTEVRKSVRDVTANDIRVFLYQYKEREKVCAGTIDHIRICINGFYEWCVEEMYVDRNPCRQVKKTKMPKTNRDALSQYELEKFRAACKDDREIAMVDFMVSSGLRVTEVANLKKTDIDFADRSIRVLHGKGDKQRVSFFGAKSELTLRKYLSRRNDDSPYLFTSSRQPYGRMSKESIEKMFRIIHGRTDIRKKVTPHILRYTFATIQLERGTPIEQVQRLLGHESPQTTLIYAQINLQDIKRNHQKYSA